MTEEMLPDWAVGLARGEYVLGASLPTRDGRRHGNAHIVAIREQDMTSIGLSDKETLYTLLTDAGSTIHMIRKELESGFWPPQWIAREPAGLQRNGIPADPRQREWLHGVMQNPLHGQSPYSEGIEEKDFRTHFFYATQL